MNARRAVAVLGLSLLLASSGCLSPNRANPHGQVMGGIVQFDDDDLQFEGTNDQDPTLTADVDLSRMPVLGFAVQQQFNDQARFVEYGVEGGMLASWDSDRASVSSNGGLTVVVKNNLFLLDAFGGAYVATTLAKRLRLYGAAGPLLMFGRISGKIEEEDGDRFSESDSSFGVGVYARVGAEFEIGEVGSLGFSVRALKSELDFDDYDEVDLEGVQYMLTYGYQF